MKTTAHRMVGLAVAGWAVAALLTAAAAEDAPVAPEASDSTEAAAPEAPHVAEDWTAHGQYTFTGQVKPGFHSPYQGPNSMNGKYQARETQTATGFLGARLWQGAEAYFDPEMSQGFGLSQTEGIAGFVNGEAQKGGSQNPKIYPARYFLKQVVGFGGEQEWIEGGANQLASSQDVSRLTVIAGGFAATRSEERRVGKEC